MTSGEHTAMLIWRRDGKAYTTPFQIQALVVELEAILPNNREPWLKYFKQQINQMKTLVFYFNVCAIISIIIKSRLIWVSWFDNLLIWRIILVLFHFKLVLKLTQTNLKWYSTKLISRIFLKLLFFFFNFSVNTAPNMHEKTCYFQLRFEV